MDERDGGWTIDCDVEGRDAVTLDTRWLLDATGRRGLVAARGAREPDRDTNTLAVVRRWRRAGGFPGVDPTHTLIESYATGWVWSVPLAADVRCFAAMIDGVQPALAGRDLDAVLDAELALSPHVGALLSGAQPLGAAWACPSSLYTSRHFARPGLLLVGDAGSFIDPLSSFGIKKALASGWRAAITTHTALSDPPMLDVSVRFFDEHERRVYAAYRRASAEFFGSCAGLYGSEYWTRRAQAAQAVGTGPPGSAVPTTDLEALDDVGVSADEARRALEALRARPTLDAVRALDVRSVERPLVRGHRLQLAEHLATDRVPEGVRWVRNVDLLRVVEVAPLHADVPDGWAAYNAAAAPVTLPDYLAALATAFAAGLLRHAD